MDCIFCSIVKGDLPCYKIYEDEDTLAFLDIAAEGEGHTLIIPKKHVSRIALADGDIISAVMKTAQKVANHYVENCGYEGYHILINNGESAGQSVHHLHVHVIPRKTGDNIEIWHPLKSEEDLQSVCDSLKIVNKEPEVIDENKTMSNVILYTDGACSGNPGMGGYSAILKVGDREKIISGGDVNTTNNRMELLGVISGLEALKYPCEVEVYSDSAYVVNAFLQDWIGYWTTHNWKTKGKGDVQNIDLWERLLELTKKHKIVWNKVKGHADNELNNRCDELARSEIEKLKKENI